MQNIQIQGADRPLWLAIAKIRDAEAGYFARQSRVHEWIRGSLMLDQAEYRVVAKSLFARRSSIEMKTNQAGA